MAQQPLVGQGLVIIEDSLSYSDTPQSVGLLWTNDQPDDEGLYVITHNNHKRQISMLLDILDSIPQCADPRLRPKGHCDQQDIKFSGGILNER
jgi:hypothetical protein